MKLPNRDKAFIPLPKLRDYLLSQTHSVGKWKAGFYRALGFGEASTELLEQRLVALAQSEDVTEVEPTAHGTKYVVDGPLRTPSGRLVHVRTVWIIDAGQDRPRLVTAYPL